MTLKLEGESEYTVGIAAGYVTESFKVVAMYGKGTYRGDLGLQDWAASPTDFR